jgi:cobalamin 5'-phosphate synthase/cobalamin synthase
MRGLLSAIGFLTRLPLPARLVFDARDVASGTAWFPLVGALVGVLEAAAASLLARALPALVSALIALALGALVSGALHLDGLADTVDGLGGGHTREDSLRIMRDHAVGAFGAVALVLVVGTQAAALAALVDARRVFAPLVIAASSARLGPVVLARWLPYARAEGGTGATVDGKVGPGALFFAVASALAVAALLDRTRGALCCTATIALAAVFGLHCRRRIGGYTGDTLGAAVELAKTLALVLELGLP